MPGEPSRWLPGTARGPGTRGSAGGCAALPARAAPAPLRGSGLGLRPEGATRLLCREGGRQPIGGSAKTPFPERTLSPGRRPAGRRSSRTTRNRGTRFPAPMRPLQGPRAHAAGQVAVRRQTKVSTQGKASVARRRGPGRGAGPAPEPAAPALSSAGKSPARLSNAPHRLGKRVWSNSTCLNVPKGSASRRKPLFFLQNSKLASCNAGSTLF